MTTISGKLSELLKDDTRIISVNYLIYSKKPDPDSTVVKDNGNSVIAAAVANEAANEAAAAVAAAVANEAANEAAAASEITDAATAATELNKIINEFSLVPIGITGITVAIKGSDFLKQMPVYMQNTDQSFIIIDDLNKAFDGSVLVGGSKSTPFKKSRKTRKNTRRYRR